MKITIIDEDDTLILSDEELDNDNFIDLEILNELAKDKDNPRGHVAECTVPVDDLLCAVQAFTNKRKLNVRRNNAYKETT